MAKIHDLFIIELAEVIKGYGNDPDVEDPFRLSEFYRFYELPNIAVSKENFEKMRPIEPERNVGEWQRHYLRRNVYADLYWHCSECGYKNNDQYANVYHKFCPNCGAKMEEGEQE